MSGDITDAMEEAIRLSDVVVIVFSEGYFNSVNCKKECNYAAKKGEHSVKEIFSDVFLIPMSNVVCFSQAIKFLATYSRRYASKSLLYT